MASAAAVGPHFWRQQHGHTKVPDLDTWTGKAQSGSTPPQAGTKPKWAVTAVTLDQ